MNEIKEVFIKKGRIFHNRRKIIYPGGIYHITQHAPGKELLFVTDQDKEYLIWLLKQTSIQYHIDIFCFTLLTNHLHILLKINESNLNKAMHNMFTTYAINFNKRYERKGHVFCGVYRASLCLNDLYLLSASLYIHLNAYRAGLTDNVFKYKWSTINMYIYPEIKKSFIKSDFILGILDNERRKATNKYKELLLNSVEIKYKNIFEEKKAVRHFAEGVKEFLSKIRPKRKLLDEIKLEEKVKIFKKYKRIDKAEELKARIYIIEQLRARGYTMEEIASELNISRRTLYNILKKLHKRG
jgi:putative transposase